MYTPLYSLGLVDGEAKRIPKANRKRKKAPKSVAKGLIISAGYVNFISWLIELHSLNRLSFTQQTQDTAVRLPLLLLGPHRPLSWKIHHDYQITIYIAIVWALATLFSFSLYVFLF